MQWRDDTTLLSSGLGLRPIGKSSECFRMTAGVKSGKAQNERMFFRFALESDIVADIGGRLKGARRRQGVGPTSKLNGRAATGSLCLSE